MDRRAANDGLAGAEVGIDDNNTTGRFMNQTFALADRPVAPDGDAVAALTALAANHIALVLTDLPAKDVLKLADAAAPKGITIFNVQAPDDRLREQNCRGNVIHVAPTRSMLTDALAQYLIWKRWRRWLLVYGSHPTDTLLANAYRRSAKRYNARIVQQREYKDIGGSRQTDTGLVQTQAQIPVFTQNAPDYDVLVAADENEVFAGYLPYRTWDPRPVTGSAGLRPCTWDPATESWGGAQMQDRFTGHYHRSMTPLDMQAWTAVRMVGEAASRTQSADPGKIMAYMKGPDFQSRRLQGHAALAAQLELAVAAADPAQRRAQHRLGLAAAGLPAPDQRSRHARRRSPRDHLQAEMRNRMRLCAIMLTALGLLAAAPAQAYIAYTSNERDNTMSVVDLDKGKVIQTVQVGQRPRGILVTPDGKYVLICASDDNTIHMIDTKTLKIVRDLPSGTDPEFFAIRPSGSPLYVSRENDALVTVIDMHTFKVIANIPTGVEPEGMGVSPNGQIIVNTSETTNMAHFISYKDEKNVANVLVGARPRDAVFKHDGSEVWVSSELGGTVSVIDPVKHVVTHTISFPIQGLRADAIQPEDIQFTPDDKLAFVALGPANRVAVVDTATYRVKKYILAGQRIWHMCFTPDDKYLLTANGLSNDITMIDVKTLRPVKSIPVGRLPWGVVVNPKSAP